TDQHDLVTAEACAELIDLSGHRNRIPRGAWEDLDGDGTADGVGQQPVDDDRQAFLAVAVVAVAGQRAGLAVVETAGNIVQDQSALTQVASGELRLQGGLPSSQPIQGAVDLVRGGLGNAELVGQGGGLPVAGCGQLGSGEENAGHDQGDAEVALPRRTSGQ